MLVNPRSDRITRLAKLQNGNARHRAGLFLVEGPQAARELVRFHPGSISELLLTEEAAARYPELLAEAPDRVANLASPEVIGAISPNAQGVVASTRLAAFPFGRESAERSDLELSSVLAVGPNPLVAVFHHIRDPGNAGTVIRAADVAGATAVVFTGDSVDISNPKVVRATVGSLFHLPVFAIRDLAIVVDQMRERGVRVLAADGAGRSTLPEAVAATSGGAGPTAWLFGNEAWGLHDDDLALADESVRVPIYGSAESLNLAMAATLCLYASASVRAAGNPKVSV